MSPTFFIGSTFGCVAGSLLGLDPGFAAAVGLIALFCGVVNSPIASIILSIELFGAQGLILFAIACGVSFMLSGYYGLYSSQKIMYSKLRAGCILTVTLNKNSRFFSASSRSIFPLLSPWEHRFQGFFSWNRISLFSICPNINLFPSLLFTNFTILIDLRLTPYFILKHELAPRLCHTAHCQDGLLVSDTGFFPDSPFSKPQKEGFI